MPMGTGFLVSPHLMLTACHVLPNPETATDAFVEFDVQDAIDGTPAAPKEYRLDPRSFFLASPDIDYALVMVCAGSDNRPPGETYGWNWLSASPGNLAIGEPVNIIGHPRGRRKEASIRYTSIADRLDNFLHYQADTEPGSAGSPVFDDEWEVVALHHAKIPRTDNQGRWVRLDGEPFRPGDATDAVDWTALEGVRITAILRDLVKFTVSSEQRSLLAEMGPASGFREEGERY
ncbi:trypsin-like serine peptidase [Streptomyces maoxianensis]|uniref:Serine protease n=1 Tax=Streptomyces maoxianensis TaxID=1459942 RepID=A0ABV9GIG8_9ACTN